MKRRNGKHASQSVARHFRQAYSQLVYVNRFFLNRKHFMMQCGTLFCRLFLQPWFVNSRKCKRRWKLAVQVRWKIWQFSLFFSLTVKTLPTKKNLVIYERTGWKLAFKYPRIYEPVHPGKEKYALILKKHCNFDGKILDFNCVRNFWQKVFVFMFPMIYIFSRNVFSINHYVLVIQFFFLPMVTLRQPLKIRTY